MPVKQKIRSKHSKNYLKVYAPYLPILLVIGFSAITFTSSNHRVEKSSSSVLSYAADTTEQGLLGATNKQRSKQNLDALAINNNLQDAAETKARDMVERNYWSHLTPDGKEPWVFVDESGYQYTKLAENLAYGFRTSESTISGWMNSPQHKENILDKDLKEVGFGIVNSANYLGKGPQTVVVAMYGTPPENGAKKVPISKTSDKPESQVSYIEAITNGKAPWNGFVAGLIVGSLAVYLLVSHFSGLRRALRIGERFVIKHPIFDILVISVVVAIAILSQTAGFIR